MKKLFNIICFVALALDVSAATWYVRTDGEDGSDGRSWETAQESIRLGMDNCKPGDTLLIEAGTYYEGIVLKDGIAVIGVGKSSWTERTSVRVSSLVRPTVSTRLSCRISSSRTHATTSAAVRRGCAEK